MNKTTGFKIHGEWMTTHCRTLWEDHEYSRALKILDCLIDSTMENRIEILMGTKKLEGVNDLDFLDDDWTPPKGYATFYEGISRGDNYSELLRRRENEAWDIAYKEWPYSRGGLVAHRGKKDTFLKVERLVGTEMAEHIFDAVMRELTDSERNYLARTGSAPAPAPASPPAANPGGVDLAYAMAQNQLMVNTVMSGGDINALPSVDAMKNRGKDITPVVCNDMSSPSGWLLPNGKYYGCESMEHIGLAEALLKDDHAGSVGRFGAEAVAESYGWVKISRSTMGLHVICVKKPTKKQLTKLWDYAELHKKDYKSMIANLNE